MHQSLDVCDSYTVDLKKHRWVSFNIRKSTRRHEGVRNKANGYLVQLLAIIAASLEKRLASACSLATDWDPKWTEEWTNNYRRWFSTIHLAGKLFILKISKHLDSCPTCLNTSSLKTEHKAKCKQFDKQQSYAWQCNWLHNYFKALKAHLWLAYPALNGLEVFSPWQPCFNGNWGIKHSPDTHVCFFFFFIDLQIIPQALHL